MQPRQRLGPQIRRWKGWRASLWQALGVASAAMVRDSLVKMQEGLGMPVTHASSGTVTSRLGSLIATSLGIVILCLITDPLFVVGFVLILAGLVSWKA